MNENLDIRVGGRYRLQSKIGGGSFGVVYQATSLESGEDVAIKLEHVSIDPSILEREVSIYRLLSGGAGIPQVYWHDTEDEYNAMAFELLGPSLEDLFNFCDRKFSLKTVLMLADQLLHRLEYIHSKQIVHRDVKPENFLMGLGKCGNLVYVTDLGIATEHRPTQPDIHRGRAQIPKLVGTARYASINGHLGFGQSRCDDLESLGYVLLYFLRGSLPWQGLEAGSPEQKEEIILAKKISISAKDLCDGFPVFAAYFSHIRSPNIDDKPNYSYLCKLFQNHFVREGFEYDHVYDWTIRKYLMATIPERLSRRPSPRKLEAWRVKQQTMKGGRRPGLRRRLVRKAL